MGFDDGGEYLLRYKASVDAANRRGETALIVAVQQRQPRMVEILLKAGASPDKADHAAGYTARDYAKRDNRNPQLLRLIETVQSTKKKVAGPGVN
jgi:ankyrin repeat protein